MQSGHDVVRDMATLLARYGLRGPPERLCSGVFHHRQSYFSADGLPTVMAVNGMREGLQRWHNPTSCPGYTRENDLWPSSKMD